MKTRVIMLLCCLYTGMAAAQTFEKDSFTTRDGKKLEITFIKHASLMLNFDGHVIQVDPISEYADYEKLPKADVLLLTHEHADHLDSVAIAACGKNGTVIIANENSQKIIGKGIVMKNGGKLTPEPWLAIEAVPAYNTTPGRDKYHPKGRDNGYILTLGGTRVYIAGDTEPIPEMKSLKNIDIAFLPVNQPYTMTVPQAVEAAWIIRPRVLYPYHYGETKVEELKPLLKKDTKIDVRIRQLQ